MTNPCGEDRIRRLLLAQERLQQVIRQEVQGWLDELWRGTYNGDSFLRFVTALGLDLSPIPNLVGKPGGFDPYRVLSLERSASDEEVKKRYRELLVKLHPDTAGIRGTEFLFQMMLAAYRQIAKERGWQS